MILVVLPEASVVIFIQYICYIATLQVL